VLPHACDIAFTDVELLPQNRKQQQLGTPTASTGSLF